MYCWHTSRRYSLIERSLRKFYRSGVQNKDPFKFEDSIFSQIEKWLGAFMFNDRRGVTFN